MARIIIVDDDEAFREVLSEVLINNGHEILDASDGNVGMEVLILNPVDVAVVDMLMPGRNGFETIRDIKNLFPKTKIIAISGSSLDDDLQTAKTIGADHTLSKPFKPTDLVSIIDELLA